MDHVAAMPASMHQERISRRFQQKFRCDAIRRIRLLAATMLQSRRLCTFLPEVYCNRPLKGHSSFPPQSNPHCCRPSTAMTLGGTY
jgi:hypothetical protein